MSRIPRLLVLSGAALVVALCARPAAADRTWTVTGGTATFSLDDRHLATLGLEAEGVRRTAPDPSREEARLEPPMVTFAVRAGSRFLTDAGGFAAFEQAVSVDGGLAFAVRNVRSGAPRPPLYLFDFEVALEPDGPRTGTLRTADPSLRAPLELGSAPVRVDEDHGTLRVTAADLRMSAAWAARLGKPELAGQWVGAFSLRLDAETADPRAPSAPTTGSGVPEHPRDAAVLDLELAELYGLSTLGRSGLYPIGVTGFSAVTTVCNVGEAPVPWIGPGWSGVMPETHPFVGLAMYRETPAGALEMIGASWIKHGFDTLPTTRCGLPCGTATGALAVGCSDTYTAADNGTRFFLGPRDEVDPYAAVWEACGSFFDAVPVDCRRDYFDFETSQVVHRIEVADTDLLAAGSRFFYEAVYYTAGDADSWNDAGWQECTLQWTGSSWASTTPGGSQPQPGPRAASWGDQQSVRKVAYNDGEVVLSVKVTALAGGTWHYEYALYNWRSRRGVGSFEVPVGAAAVSNAAFRDPDGDAANDWTPTVANGTVRWDTSAHPLRYQALFNFRFDADAPPAAASAVGEAFDPGIGSTFVLPTQAPAAPAPDPGARPEAAATGGPALAVTGANPFSDGTRVAVRLARAQPARVAVIDAAGRTVRVLSDGDLPAGRTEIRWDGHDSRGARTAAGVYFVRLVAGGGAHTRKVTRLP